MVPPDIYLVSNRTGVVLAMLCSRASAPFGTLKVNVSPETDALIDARTAAIPPFPTTQASYWVNVNNGSLVHRLNNGFAFADFG